MSFTLNELKEMFPGVWEETAQYYFLHKNDDNNACCIFCWKNEERLDTLTKLSDINDINVSLQHAHRFYKKHFILANFI